MFSLRKQIKKLYYKSKKLKPYYDRIPPIIAIFDLTSIFIGNFLLIIDLIYIYKFYSSCKNIEIHDFNIKINNDNIQMDLTINKNLTSDFIINDCDIIFEYKKHKIELFYISTKIIEKNNITKIYAYIKMNEIDNNFNYEDIISLNEISKAVIYCKVNITIDAFYNYKINLKPQFKFNNISKVGNNKKLTNFNLKSFQFNDNIFKFIFNSNYFDMHNLKIKNLNIEFNNIIFDLLYLGNIFRITPIYIKLKNNELIYKIKIEIIQNNTIYNADYNKFKFINTNCLTLKNILHKEFDLSNNINEKNMKNNIDDVIHLNISENKIKLFLSSNKNIYENNKSNFKKKDLCILNNKLYNSKNENLCDVTFKIHLLKIYLNEKPNYIFEINIKNQKENITMQLAENYLTNKYFYIINEQFDKNIKFGYNFIDNKIFIGKNLIICYLDFLNKHNNLIEDNINLMTFFHDISINNNSLVIKTFLNDKLIKKNYNEKNKFYNIKKIIPINFYLNGEIKLKNGITMQIKGNKNIIETKINIFDNKNINKNNLTQILNRESDFCILPKLNFMNEYFNNCMNRKIIPFDMKLTDIQNKKYYIKIDANRFKQNKNYKNNPITKDLYNSIKFKHIFKINNIDKFEFNEKMVDITKFKDCNKKLSESKFTVKLNNPYFTIYMGKELIIDDMHIIFHNPVLFFNYLFEPKYFCDNNFYINIFVNILKERIQTILTSNKNNKKIYDLKYIKHKENYINENNNIIENKKLFINFYKNLKKILNKCKLLENKMLNENEIDREPEIKDISVRKGYIYINKKYINLYKKFDELFIDYINFLNKYSYFIENINLFGMDERIKIAELLNYTTIKINVYKKKFDTHKFLLDFILFNIKSIKITGYSTNSVLLFMENNLVNNMDNQKNFFKESFKVLFEYEIITNVFYSELEIIYRDGTTINIILNKNKNDYELYVLNLTNDIIKIIYIIFDFQAKNINNNTNINKQEYFERELTYIPSNYFFLLLSARMLAASMFYNIFDYMVLTEDA